MGNLLTHVDRDWSMGEKSYLPFVKVNHRCDKRNIGWLDFKPGTKHRKWRAWPLFIFARDFRQQAQDLEHQCCAHQRRVTRLVERDTLST